MRIFSEFVKEMQNENVVKELAYSKLKEFNNERLIDVLIYLNESESLKFNKFNLYQNPFFREKCLIESFVDDPFKLDLILKTYDKYINEYTKNYELFIVISNYIFLCCKGDITICSGIEYIFDEYSSLVGSEMNDFWDLCDRTDYRYFIIVLKDLIKNLFEQIKMLKIESKDDIEYFYLISSNVVKQNKIN